LQNLHILELNIPRNITTETRGEKKKQPAPCSPASVTARKPEMERGSPHHEPRAGREQLRAPVLLAAHAKRRRHSSSILPWRPMLNPAPSHATIWDYLPAEPALAHGLTRAARTSSRLLHFHA